MSLIDKKLGAYTYPITSEADQPNRSAAEMKTVFQQNAEDIKAAFNGLIDYLTEGGGTQEAIMSTGNLLQLRIGSTGALEYTPDNINWYGVAVSAVIAENHAQQHAAGGVDPVTPSAIGAATAAHASAHAAGGADELTAADIGAAKALEFTALLDKDNWTGTPNMPRATACAYTAGTYALTMPTWTPGEYLSFKADAECNTMTELYNANANSAGYIKSNGVLTSQASVFSTEFIAIDPNKTYSYAGFGSNSTAHYVAYYTSANVFISGVTCASLGASGTLANIPATAAYVRFTLYTTYVSTFSLKTYVSEKPVYVTTDQRDYVIVDSNGDAIMPEIAANQEIVLELTNTQYGETDYKKATISTLMEYALIKPWTQEVNVAGMAAEYAPVVDVALSDNNDTKIAEMKGWSCVSVIYAGIGKITVLCAEKKPAVDLNITMMEVS